MLTHIPSPFFSTPYVLALIYTQPPAVPILPPKYTSPAPVKQPPLASNAPAVISAATVPSAEEVLAACTTGAAASGSDGGLAVLDARLMYFSYVGGFQPAAADAAVLSAITANAGAGGAEAAATAAAAHGNVARWLRSVQSFSAAETAQWK